MPALTRTQSKIVEEFKSAIVSNDNQEVQTLILSGKSVNIGSDNNSPLAIASSLGNVEMMEMLLSWGALVDGDQWNNPLHMACLYGGIRATKLLLKKEANVNKVDSIYGNTALMAAIKIYNFDVDKKSDSDDISNSEMSQIISALLDNGADSNIFNFNGEGPTDLRCRGYGGHNIRIMLLQNFDSTHDLNTEDDSCIMLLDRLGLSYADSDDT